ncbi:uncharacterized protein LOC105190190 [Harpegnathos saltator]|uniref:uncharacterized protein LOC105190190 n=1 Tax=Harpegnathos saltator TaxID=610380 RepID=UPI00058D22FB|nr:uncharacterized protein LOC105190190 [Harpegnathos saltator]
MAAKVDERDHAITKQESQAHEKDCSSGTKVKRKSRSARRRLNAMMSNASLHFSDTDSEGELTIITSKIGKLNPTLPLNDQPSPLISVVNTEDGVLGEARVNDNVDYLIADGEIRSQRSNFADNLTDVDEIYSDAETEDKDDKNKLNVAENSYQGETDLEDIEADEDIQPIIYVALRENILNEFNGEMITTKEGDGPFSVEVRNRLSREEVSIDQGTEDMPDMPNTDSEDVETSEDEKLDEAASPEIVYEDFDILAASQIVMTNKVENNLLMSDNIDEAISDCHTDIEDVD